MRHTRDPTKGLAPNDSRIGDRVQMLDFLFLALPGQFRVARRFARMSSIVACRQEVGKELDWTIAVTKPVESQATE